MATPAEIRQRVGEDLALVPIGQALEAHDNTRITAAYREVYGRLNEKGLAIWPLTGNVPDTLAPFFSLMICEKLLTSYSVPEARYMRIRNDAGPNGDMAEINLAKLAMLPADDSREATDY